MYKIVLILLLGLSVLEAGKTFKVTGGSVELDMADNQKLFKAGDSGEITCPGTILWLDGSGSIEIYDNDKKIATLSKKSDAYEVFPEECEGFLEVTARTVKATIFTLLNTNEQISNGLSKKGIDSTSYKKDINVKKSDENIVLFAPLGQWGAEKYRLDILRQDKVIKEIEVKNFQYRDESYVAFAIPINILKSGDTYKIHSGVGRLEMHQKIPLSGIINLSDK